MLGALVGVWSWLAFGSRARLEYVYFRPSCCLQTNEGYLWPLFGRLGTTGGATGGTIGGAHTGGWPGRAQRAAAPPRQVWNLKMAPIWRPPTNFL